MNSKKTRSFASRRPTSSSVAKKTQADAAPSSLPASRASLPFAKDDWHSRLRGLPKIELHRHAEGALPLKTLWQIHQRRNLKIFHSFRAFERLVVIPNGRQTGFQDFLSRFLYFRFYWGEAEEIERIAGEMTTAAADDGIAHLELRFSPVFGALRMRQAPEEEKSLRNLAQSKLANSNDQSAANRRRENKRPTLAAPFQPEYCFVKRAAEAFIEGARAAAKRRDISVSFICSLKRDFGLRGNRKCLELLSAPTGGEFAGIDLAGDETYSAKPFYDFFRRWRKKGRKATIHAGETGLWRNVSAAVKFCAADRIGHGTAAIKSPTTLALLRRRKTTLECCPTSNFQTCATNSFPAHPLKRFLRQGLSVTINTDDPTISGVTLTDEYVRGMKLCGLTANELAVVAINGVRAAFVGDKLRARLAERIGDSWKSFIS
jgi:adenosine deaminase